MDKGKVLEIAFSQIDSMVKESISDTTWKTIQAFMSGLGANIHEDLLIQKIQEDLKLSAFSLIQDKHDVSLITLDKFVGIELKIESQQIYFITLFIVAYTTDEDFDIINNVTTIGIGEYT